jgi:hypothetical protein
MYLMGRIFWYNRRNVNVPCFMEPKRSLPFSQKSAIFFFLFWAELIQSISSHPGFKINLYAFAKEFQNQLLVCYACPFTYISAATTWKNFLKFFALRIFTKICRHIRFALKLAKNNRRCRWSPTLVWFLTVAVTYTRQRPGSLGDAMWDRTHNCSFVMCEVRHETEERVEHRTSITLDF